MHTLQCRQGRETTRCDTGLPSRQMQHAHPSAGVAAEAPWETLLGGTVGLLGGASKPPPSPPKPPSNTANASGTRGDGAPPKEASICRDWCANCDNFGATETPNVSHTISDMVGVARRHHQQWPAGIYQKCPVSCYSTSNLFWYLMAESNPVVKVMALGGAMAFGACVGMTAGSTGPDRAVVKFEDNSASWMGRTWNHLTTARKQAGLFLHSNVLGTTLEVELMRKWTEAHPEATVNDTTQFRDLITALSEPIQQRFTDWIDDVPEEFQLLTASTLPALFAELAKAHNEEELQRSQARKKQNEGIAATVTPKGKRKRAPANAPTRKSARLS